jgi:hypothetical protein
MVHVVDTTTVVCTQRENLTCFHVASIVFAVCTEIVRRITIKDVALERVYRYGRGIRRAPTLREIWTNR